MCAALLDEHLQGAGPQPGGEHSARGRGKGRDRDRAASPPEHTQGTRCPPEGMDGSCPDGPQPRALQLTVAAERQTGVLWLGDS